MEDVCGSCVALIYGSAGRSAVEVGCCGRLADPTGFDCAGQLLDRGGDRQVAEVLYALACDRIPSDQSYFLAGKALLPKATDALRRPVSNPDAHGSKACRGPALRAAALTYGLPFGGLEHLLGKTRGDVRHMVVTWLLAVRDWEDHGNISPIDLVFVRDSHCPDQNALGMTSRNGHDRSF